MWLLRPRILIRIMYQKYFGITFFGFIFITFLDFVYKIIVKLGRKSKK